MSWPPVIDENAGWELKIRTMARATNGGDPAAALAALLGRPFPGMELFDRIPDTVFFIKDQEARYVAVNETLAHRCGFADSHGLIGRKASEVFAAPLGERFEAQDLKVIAEGLSIRGRMELHLYPDSSEGWCLTWKEPLIDTAGVIRGLAGVSRDAPALSRSAPVSVALSTTFAYIDDHLDQPLRTPELAARARLSLFQFDQRIRALFGLSAGQYLSRLRIGRACDRLRHTDAPLREVALECGYADQAAFTRQFHKSVGLTPGAYRTATARGRKARNSGHLSNGR
jgi:AraC-like DNA-binding protein